MPLGQAVRAHLPYLRRFARALTGSRELGDDLVRQTLEKALANEDLRASLAGGVIPLYHALNGVWVDAMEARGTAEDRAAGQNGTAQASTAQARLNAVTPLNRQALLLTSLEDFSKSDTARILDISEAEVDRLVAQAIDEIEHQQATDVLIIEDEPLIAMQLSEIVRSLGHSMCGIAATRDNAKEVMRESRPGLVLADIMLADGSSGIDAVAEIVAQQETPVIFITAFPERLLTGENSEPTYLITKPFQEQTVRTAIGQALFMGPGSAQ